VLGSSSCGTGKSCARSPGLAGDIVPDVPDTEVPEALLDDEEEFRRSPIPDNDEGGPRNMGERLPKFPWHRIKKPCSDNHWFIRFMSA